MTTSVCSKEHPRPAGLTLHHRWRGLAAIAIHSPWGMQTPEVVPFRERPHHATNRRVPNPEAFRKGFKDTEVRNAELFLRSSTQTAQNLPSQDIDATTPRRFHMAVSIAPVSDAGTMATCHVSGIEGDSMLAYHRLQPLFSQNRTMGSSEDSLCQHVNRPSGPFTAWS